MPTNPSYKNFRGLQFSRFSQLKQLSNRLEESFTSSTTLAPQVDDAVAWYNRADAFANLGCYEEALASFNKVIELQPNDHAAWLFRGVVLIHLRRYEEALISCDKALEIQPNDQEAWMFRGAALNYLGRYKEAYNSYDKALGVEKTSIWQKLTQLCKGLLQRPLTSLFGDRRTGRRFLK